MATVVRYIQASGIYGRFDLEVELQPGVNIVYGKNGSEKTTLLHILANIFNGDFECFAFLPFETIEVGLDDGQNITLREYSQRDGNNVDVYINNRPCTAFFVQEIQEKCARRLSSHRAGHASRSTPILSTVYFPAFRTLGEASGYDDEATPDRTTGLSLGDRRTAEGRSRESNSSDVVHRFSGHFVPSLNYPSLEDVSRRLSQALQKL